MKKLLTRAKQFNLDIKTIEDLINDECKRLDNDTELVWWTDEEMLSYFKMSRSSLYRLRKKALLIYTKVNGRYFYPRNLVFKFMLMQLQVG